MDRINGQVPTGTYHQKTESFWTVYDQGQRGGPKLGAKIRKKKTKGDRFRSHGEHFSHSVQTKKRQCEFPAWRVSRGLVCSEVPFLHLDV